MYIRMSYFRNFPAPRPPKNGFMPAVFGQKKFTCSVCAKMSTFSKKSPSPPNQDLATGLDFKKDVHTCFR